MDKEVRKNSRIGWIDALKGIVIILVVFGHNIQYGSGGMYLQEKSFYNDLVFKFIYSFHMPCFMLISGYFFGFTVKKDDFIRNRIQNLLVPIALWSMIPAGIRISNIINEKPISYKAVISTFLRTQFTYYWFLWAVFVCSVLVWIMYKMHVDMLVPFIIVGIGLLFTIDWLNTEYWKYMYPYFVSGYLWNKKHKNFQMVGKQKYYLLLASSAIYFVMFYFYNESSYIYTSGIQVKSFSQLIIDLYRWGIGYAGSIMLIMVVYICYDYFENNIPFLNRALAYIGKASLLIYIIDILLNEYVIRIVTANFSLNYVITLFETVIVMLFCIFVYCGIKRNLCVRKCLLGSR